MSDFVSNTENRVYFKLSQGGFLKRLVGFKDGCTVTKSPDGSEYYYDKFTRFVGNLTDIRVTDSQYGKQWNFDFEKGGKFATITAKYASNVGYTLLNSLANVPGFGRFPELTLETWQTKGQDGKSFTNIGVKVGGQKVAWKFSREEMPQVVKMVSKTGKTTYQGEDEKAEFFDNAVEKFIRPRLPKTPAVVETADEPADYEELAF